LRGVLFILTAVGDANHSIRKKCSNESRPPNVTRIMPTSAKGGKNEKVQIATAYRIGAGYPGRI
jgi:hypothetical protein